MGFTAATLRARLPGLARHMEEAGPTLNDLDGLLGDGDLGITCAAGTRAMADLAATLPDDVGQAFMAAAQAWMKASSSSFGTLIATGLMSAARATKGETEIGWERMPALLDGARDAMMARGKAALGDKTVLDALDAAARALERGSSHGDLRVAAAAAAAMVERMRDLPAKVGRARIFERSAGMDDPGMVAFVELLRGLAA